MNEPVWISKRAVLAMHLEQLAEHGGASGIRDENLLDSALAKPQNVFAYSEETDLFTLAASYAFEIACNHAFVDGNKRTALVVSMTFVDRNGFEINTTLQNSFLTFLNLAAGTISEEDLATWFRGHAPEYEQNHPK